MKNTPKVSILCTTYNQGKYIRQTLESFIFQKTNFTYEILINDDASTDNTTDIIKEFQHNYPKLIKATFQKENLYSKGIRNITTSILLPKSKGKYISICEGDDYFLDKYKLQKQVDFLDKNHKYTICFHPVKVFFENGEEKDSIYPDPHQSQKFTVEKLIKWNFIQTNSVMYRRQNYENISKKNVMPADWYLHLYHSKFGKIGFINDVMSAYRRHGKSVWWDSYKNKDRLLKNNGIAQLTFYFELLDLFKNTKKYLRIILSHINILLNNLSKIDIKYHSNLLQEAFTTFPAELSVYYSYVYENNIDLNTSEKYKEITDSKFYKLWPIYTKTKRLVLGFFHKLH